VTPERYESILHKSHGWLDAPGGCWFEQRGKMVLLIEPETARKVPGDGTLYGYPYGTQWRASSIWAYAGERVLDSDVDERAAYQALKGRI
jgi:hypothetical protein